MRSAQTWLDAYGESHQNPTNKLIHWVCIPLIMWSLIALIAQLPAPEALSALGLDYAALLLALISLYYLRLSLTLALGMGAISVGLWWAVGPLEQASGALGLSALQGALAVFVIAWIGQFIGHKIEGQKPSFFEDLQFLLIGPMWLLSALYRALGVPY